MSISNLSPRIDPTRFAARQRIVPRIVLVRTVLMVQQRPRHLRSVARSEPRPKEVPHVADVRRLPRPVAELWEWQLSGACRDLDSLMFFRPEHERGAARATREARAKQVCHGCPVIENCRNHALTVREPYGVWGALTKAERDALIRSDA